MTYKFVMLEVLPSTHEDIKRCLEAAGHHDAIDPENGCIDMTGITLLPRGSEITKRVQAFVNARYGDMLTVEAKDVGDALDEAPAEEK